MASQISHHGEIRRNDICLYVSPANRAWLNVIIKDRNSSRKVVWCAEIVLAASGGLEPAGFVLGYASAVARCGIQR